MLFKAKLSAIFSHIHNISDISIKCINKNYENFGKIKLLVKKDSVSFFSNNGRVALKISIDLTTLDDINSIKIINEGEITLMSHDLIKVFNSFTPNQELIFELKGNDFYVIKADDIEEFQVIQTLNDNLTYPTLSSSFIKSAELERMIFCNGIKKVLFAAGFEESKKELTYWVLRIAEDKLRFLAGSGGRFAAYDLEGKDLIKSNPNTFNFLFPKDYTDMFVRILDKLEDKNCLIKQSDPKSSSFQMTISCGNYEFILSNMIPNLKWPDENVIFKLDYPYKIVSKLENWDLAIKGVLATFKDSDKKDGKPHIVNVGFDFNKKYMKLDVSGSMKSNRKIDILDYQKPDDLFTFKCCSLFLSEIANQSSGQVQIHGISGSKPIVIYFYANNSVDDPINLKRLFGNIEERFVIFIAPIQ
jgi:DNA polymerase III sliding clamp (beta) subunit (PCNA family)